MNYTETYRKIYDLFSNLDITHEAANRASLRIANALHDIYSFTQRQAPHIIDEVASIVQEFSSNVKDNKSYIIGGYDLDDKN